MRPMLRPGTHVLQRPGGHLQVGLDPDSALLLPDTPAARAGLRLLATSADREAYADPSPLDLLAAADHLLDERDLMRLLGDDDLSGAASAALARDTGPGLGAARAARRRWRTRTGWFGHPTGEGLRESFIALARSAGLREAAPRRAAAPDCGVLVGVGEPDRDRVDEWTRGGTPYLLVRLTEGRAVLGPFVQPGATACLRCLDAHCTDADPAWPLLVRQYADASARDRADGAPEPVDPLLAAVALAWAARDLATFVDGGTPSTWSATVTLHPRLSRLETRIWLRHPACGCSWQ
ncbi:MAG TPA: TOMM precursor leader peptide-binding protein [Nocardioidaceae bacterium]|nr:TOMM precursor leader peptide-binding protein [Nocardioidaceae bacterium]